MSDDYLTQDEALTEIVDRLFTEYGPQINIDNKKLVDALWKSVNKGLDPEEEEIAAVGLLVGCLNGTLTMALERWGVDVTVKILKELTKRYEGYLDKVERLN